MPAHDPAAPPPAPVVPTQKDVALLAGVSPVTVSRTLAGGKNVRPDLQQRVIDAVRTLDYLPNESARTLRPGQQSGLIGVAITNLSNPFYGRFALGVEEVVADHGRYMLLGSTGESASRESDLVANFLSRRVEGLIVVPAGEPSPRRWLRRLGQVPVVAASRELADAPVDTVLLDDDAAAARVARDLVDDHHRTIAFIGNIVSVSAHRRRFETLQRVLGEHGRGIDRRFVRGVTDELADAADHARSFLDAPHPPQAIVAANNRIAVGVLSEHLRRVEGGAAAQSLPLVVSFDDIELSELMRARVRSYGADPRELGRRAALTLFERLEGVWQGEARRLVV